MTVIPVRGGIVTLLLICLAQLNLQLSLLFPQVPTEGGQLSDHFLLTIWSKQREWVSDGNNKYLSGNLWFTSSQAFFFDLVAGVLPQGLVGSVVLTQSAPVVEIVGIFKFTFTPKLQLWCENIYTRLLSDLQSCRRVGSQQRKVWKPQDLSASSVTLGWEEMALSVNLRAESLDKDVQ